VERAAPVTVEIVDGAVKSKEKVSNVIVSVKEP
jgi:hypothetical protein